MSGTWVKVFEDSSTEQGSDQMIKEQKASWTNGKLSNIKEVFLSEGLSATTLSALKTDWYQFDRMLLIEGHTQRQYRCIQAQVQKPYINKYICSNCDKNNKHSWTYVSDKPNSCFNYKITISDVGKWISIKLDKSGATVFLSEQRGSINGPVLK